MARYSCSPICHRTHGAEMPIFLDTSGRSTLGIGICDRCKMKFSLEELQPDRNIPGLRVCAADNDEFDPWRLPAIQDDRLNLPFMRPDLPLDVPADAVVQPTLRITDDLIDYRDVEDDEFDPDYIRRVDP